MKQQSPLRKKQNYVQTTHAIEAYINKPTPPKIDAQRRETDKCESQCWEPCGEHEHARVISATDKDHIRKAAQSFVGGLGLGAAVVAVGAMIIGKPVIFGTTSMLIVVCMLGYLWLDDDKLNG